MVVGHERQIKYLEKVLQNGRFAHAYLFLGPEGVGKFAVAKNFSKLFYCRQMLQVNNDRCLSATFAKICDVCSDCVWIERGVHPQVFILGLENTLVSKKDKRKEIPIGDIRELKRILSFAPAGEQWRVVIINQADKMSKEAESAFLKILEEPGSLVLFILVGEDRDSFSETIISRTQVINFSLLPEKILAGFLQSQNKDHNFIREVLLLAQGRAGVIIKMLADKQILVAELKLFKEIRDLLQKKDIAGALSLAEKTAGEDSVRQKAVLYLLGAIRERLLLGPQPLSADVFLTLQAIKKIHRVWQIMETTNVNPRLAMDVIFLEALPR